MCELELLAVLSSGHQDNISYDIMQSAYLGGTVACAVHVLFVYPVPELKASPSLACHWCLNIYLLPPCCDLSFIGFWRPSFNLKPEYELS
jgi:hypothetical protein